jgi:nitroimidazol reductase NimA-like FMN-containing flavoprotein (pyridoxamine 5'-phosphate oxidase superfamily)
MRRKDREITSFDEITEIIRKCSVCRVAFFDEGYPYIIPLNFGWDKNGEKLTLWFHCAGEGKKLDLLRKNNRVAFELDCPGRFIEGDKACEGTMTYESVCGSGILEIAGDVEKILGLTHVMRQYSSKSSFEFDEREVKAVTVLKLTVTELTGKRLAK